jgi:hypothetical protein
MPVRELVHNALWDKEAHVDGRAEPVPVMSLDRNLVSQQDDNALDNPTTIHPELQTSIDTRPSLEEPFSRIQQTSSSKELEIWLRANETEEVASDSQIARRRSTFSLNEIRATTKSRLTRLNSTPSHSHRHFCNQFRTFKYL